MTSPVGSIGIGVTIDAGDLDTQITKAVQAAMGDALAQVKAGMSGMNSALSKVDTSGFAAVSAAASSAASEVGKTASASSSAREESAKFATAAHEAAAATDKAGKSAADAAWGQASLGEAYGDVRRSLGDYSAAAATAAREQLKLNAETEKGPSLFSKLSGGLSDAAGKVGKMAGVVGGLVGLGGIGTVLTKGLGRLTAIDDAKAKLDGLGHAAESVDTIMKSALAGVKGTAFGLGDAASLAASVVASGVKPGQELERTIKLVGDAASIAGTDLGSMGDIFNRVAATGKVSGDTLQQLGARGVPILQLLGNQLGKTSEEVTALVSKGQVDFAAFQDAIEKGMGGAALTAGGSFRGAVDNIGASLGRLGAAILDAPFKAAPALIGKMGEAIDGVTDKIGALSKLLIQGDFTEAFSKAFHVQEDSPLVDRILSVREAFLKSADTAKLFFAAVTGGNIASDLPWASSVAKAGELVSHWGFQIKDIFGSLKDIFAGLAQPVADIVASLATASAALGVSAWSLLLDVVKALVPVLGGVLVPVVETIARFMRDNQAVVTALVAAYTAWRAVALVNTAVVKAYAIGIRAYAIAATVATKAQKLWNLAMKANGIGLVITAITAIVAALGYFFTKTETGRKVFETLRNAVVKVFDAIKSAVGTAISFVADHWKMIIPIVLGPLGGLIALVATYWDQIKAVFVKAFEAIGTALSFVWTSVILPVWEAFKSAVSTLAGVVMTVLVTPAITAWNLLAAAISATWSGVIKPAFDAWASVVQWLWNSVILPVFGFIRAGISAVGTAASWLWNNAIKPAFSGIGTAISAAWSGVIMPVFEAVKAGISAVGTAASWLWNNAIKPAWDGIGAAISFVWNSVILPVFDLINAGLHRVGDTASWLWNSAIKPAWDGIGTAISFVWNSVISPTFEALKTGLSRVGDFFSTVVSGIRNVWDSLRGILAKPINFMIGTVYNNGIRKAWNIIEKFIPGISVAPELATIPEHYTGGKISGRKGRDNVLMWGSDNEHMLTVSDVAKAGGHSIIYAIRDMIQRGVPFEWDNGQLVQKLGRNNLESYGTKVQNKGLGNVNPEGLFDRLRPSGVSLPKFYKGGPVEEDLPWVRQLMAGHAFAKAQAGKPYQWAGPSGQGSSFDCSGFMGSVAAAILGHNPWQRYWATSSFAGYPGSGPQGFVRGVDAGFTIGVTDDPGGPGGGHTAGVLGAAGPFGVARVESGGNAGDVHYGYGTDPMSFASQYHLPIGANGFFNPGSGGGAGPSPADQRSFLERKVSDTFDKVLNPIKDGIGAAIGKAPPAYRDIPPKFLDTAKDTVVHGAFKIVGGLGDRLGEAWGKAQSVGRNVLDFLNPFDSGGVATGKGFMPKNVIAPERVLSPEQTKLFEALVAALQAISGAGGQAAGSVVDAIGSAVGSSMGDVIKALAPPVPVRAAKASVDDAALKPLTQSIDAQGQILSDTSSQAKRTESSRAAVQAMQFQMLGDQLTEVANKLTGGVLGPVVQSAMQGALGIVKSAVGASTQEITSAQGDTTAAVKGLGDKLDEKGKEPPPAFGMPGSAFDAAKTISDAVVSVSNTASQALMSLGEDIAKKALEQRTTPIDSPRGRLGDDKNSGGFLVDTLVRLTGVDIQVRDAMYGLAEDVRKARGDDFKTFDETGALLSDTAGLMERSASSQDQVIAEQNRINRELLKSTLRFLMVNIVIPVITAIMTALITVATTAIAAGIGATIGSIIPGLGTAIGGAIGAAVGAAAGTALSAAAAAAIAGIGVGAGAAIDAFDSGGVAHGIGVMPKNTIAPERVLSPRQTGSFERLVDILDGAGLKSGGSTSKTVQVGSMTIHGSDAAETTADNLLALLNS